METLSRSAAGASEQARTARRSAAEEQQSSRVTPTALPRFAQCDTGLDGSFGSRRACL
jgi:hypothetical protein